MKSKSIKWSSILGLWHKNFVAALLLCSFVAIGFTQHVLWASPLAEQEFFLVEGIVYADGYTGVTGRTALITNVQVIDAPRQIEQRFASEYAVTAENDIGDIVAIANISVSFAPATDSGNDAPTYAAYAVLIPYDPAIEEFNLYNSKGEWLDYYELKPFLHSIDYFDIEETDTGYALSWDVLLEEVDDDFLGDMLVTYDVMAVQVSGEKNVLAYRSEEQSLTVPYEHLDPNDTIVFRLLAYDGAIRLEELSDEYTTPDGAADAAQDEEWYEKNGDSSEEESKGTNMMVWIIVPIALLAVAGFVLMRKKR